MAEFLGKLCIFVDPFEAVGEPRRPALGDGDIFGRCEPGDKRWYSSGWAIGKNGRGAYCARTSASKLQCFATFADAMDFVRKKRKTCPKDSFHLVYEFDQRKSIVTSLEQIRRLDGQLVGAVDTQVAEAEQRHELEALSGKVGRIVATNALVLLGLLTREGDAEARARFSNATYERLCSVLQEAGLLEASA